MSETYSQYSYNGMVDRRSGFDRRQRGMPSLKSIFTHRRRHQLRRKDDHKKIVLLDYYGAKNVIMVVAILLLSIVDAVLTLFLIGHGAVELNPVMAYFLEIGASVFMGVKYLLTAVSALIILVLNYAFVRRLNLHARSLLNYFAGLFALVVIWELFLVARYVV